MQQRTSGSRSRHKGGIGERCVAGCVLQQNRRVSGAGNSHVIHHGALSTVTEDPVDRRICDRKAGKLTAIRHYHGIADGICNVRSSQRGRCRKRRRLRQFHIQQLTGRPHCHKVLSRSAGNHLTFANQLLVGGQIHQILGPGVETASGMHKHNIRAGRQTPLQRTERIVHCPEKRPRRIVAVDMSHGERSSSHRVQCQLTRSILTGDQRDDVQISAYRFTKSLNRRTLQMLLTAESTDMHNGRKRNRRVKLLVIRDLQPQLQPASNVRLQTS